MKPVTDASLIDQLERPAPRPVTDPEVLRQLDAEVTPSDTLADAGESALRGFNKGLAGVVTAPYRAIDWAGEKITGGDFLPNAEDMPLYKPFLQQPEPKTTVGRYAGSAGEAIGASALPTGALVSQAPRLAQGSGVLSNLARPIARNPGAAVAADVASAGGAGVGTEAAKDAGFGPVGQFMGGIVGGVSPLAATGLASRTRGAIQSARANSDPAARVASGLGDQSVDDLASSVAVGATRDVEAVSRRVLDTLGEEMVRHGGDRQAAVRSTLARLVREHGIAPATARDGLRRVTQAQADSELLFGEYPAVASSNRDTRLARNPANVADEAAGRIEDSGVNWEIDTVANAGTGASAQRVRNAVTERAPALREQMRTRLQAMAPNGQTLADADQLVAQMTRQARQEYDAVYNAPGGTAVNYRVLHGLLPRIVDRHLNRMAGRSGEQAEALQRAVNELFIDLPNGQRIIMPSLQMLQDMRGAIRGMITNASSPTNPRPHIAATLQPLYRDITSLMERASPQWATANRRWADLNIAERARDLGEAFVQRAGPRSRAQIEEFRALAPEARDLVRVEFAQKLIDKIDNAGDTHDLAKLFSTPHIRGMVRLVLGDAAAVDMARLIRDNRVATQSARMLGGSPTQPRLARQKAADADLGILASVENASASGFRKWLIEKTVGILRERRNRGVADIITTPMRDTAGVAMSLERMRRAAARAGQAAQPAQRQPGLGRYPGSASTALDDEE